MELTLEEAGKVKTGKVVLGVVLPELVEGAEPELLAEVVPVADAPNDAGTEAVDSEEMATMVLDPNEEPPGL